MHVSVLHQSGEFEVLRPSQHFKHVVVLLKPSLNHVYFVGGRAILLKEAQAFRQYYFHEKVYLVCNTV